MATVNELEFSSKLSKLVANKLSPLITIAIIEECSLSASISAVSSLSAVLSSKFLDEA
jgi:hypothetical protein